MFKPLGHLLGYNYTVSFLVVKVIGFQVAPNFELYEYWKIGDIYGY